MLVLLPRPHTPTDTRPPHRTPPRGVCCVACVCLCVCAASGDTRVCLPVFSRKVKALRGCHVGACACLCVPTHTDTYTRICIYVYIYTQATPKTWRMRRTSPLLPRLRLYVCSPLYCSTTRDTVVCVCVRVRGLFHGARQHSQLISLSLCVCVCVCIYKYMYHAMIHYMQMGGWCVLCIMSRCRAKACVLCYACAVRMRCV